MGGDYVHVDVLFRLSLLLTLSFISLEAVYIGVQAGVTRLRFFYLGSVAVLVCIHLTILRRPKPHLALALVLLALWTFVHIRIFTPALYRFNYVDVRTAFDPSVEAVIMTFPGSPRGNRVESWVKPLVDRYAYLTGYTVEQNTTSVTHLIDDAELSERVKTAILRSNIRRIVDIMQRYSGSGHADWILYLEDDAAPLDGRGFGEVVDSLRSVAGYDVIVLDYRSVMMGILPGSTIGIAGAMLRRSSLSKIIERVVDGYRTMDTRGGVIGVDGMIGYLVDRGELTGTCVPSVLETKGPSTMDWGREDVAHVHIVMEKFVVYLIFILGFCWLEWSHYWASRCLH